MLWSVLSDTETGNNPLPHVILIQLMSLWYGIVRSVWWQTETGKNHSPNEVFVQLLGDIQVGVYGVLILTDLPTKTQVLEEVEEELLTV